ncbi:putative kinase [Friedmanniella endophytica]|uniref:Putative kinase n=1 Tax=Microlunatus kandeliicorticis TaxID=1759536 RepID=A0A7W3ITY3_9ACTN|nr:hypothetical protein [Microlunatus kandeliicorticis]MBA8795217.1 putative kinase [Microlunatus kandeliicorticis]
MNEDADPPTAGRVRPLVITGGPAAGKTTCGRRLAEQRDRAAYVDADDIRQLVVAGAATLWSGPEGEAQAALGARHCSLLARSFSAAGFAVVISDVLTPATLEVYRRELPDCLVVALRISFGEARRRAATRPVHLTDDEFAWLHALTARPLEVDAVLPVDGLSVDDQVAELRRLWSG